MLELLVLPLAFAFINVDVLSQTSKSPDADAQLIQSSLVGGVLTCFETSTAHTIHVATPLVARAKLKAQLATLLGDSLFDDAQGIVNIAREKEIRKLANKLRREKESD
jgi:hypothetical protein